MAKTKKQKMDKLVLFLIPIEISPVLRDLITVIFCY